MNTEEEKTTILSIMIDIAQDDKLPEYLKHIGFDAGAISEPKDMMNAILGHYRLGQGFYDMKRVFLDFTTWPPIARRIFELQADKSECESLA